VTPLENISVLLVRPEHAGNIGAAARAMKNMGLRTLKLVQPTDPLGKPSRMMAVTAFDLVERARIFDTVEAAVAEEQIVVGTTSARGRRLRTRIQSLRDLAPRLRAAAESQRVCLVFGPERGGLTEPELARCQYLLTIPSAEALPTLNLAQSVLLVAYEIRNAVAPSQVSAVGLADQRSLDRMFAHVERTLTSIGFLSRQNPGHIMRAIRRFLSKSELTPRDVRIIRGVMSRMDWYVEQGYKLDPDRVRKP
jgi:tRNA/rRNA methyltransferase